MPSDNNPVAIKETQQAEIKPGFSAYSTAPRLEKRVAPPPDRRGKQGIIIAMLAAVKAFIASYASPAKKVDSPMFKKAITQAEIARWINRRDKHLAGIERDPALAVESEEHADVAVLEEWLEGNITDERIREYMAAYPNCSKCKAAYDRYKALKTSKSNGTGR
jgi:hypothetical protein